MHPDETNDSPARTVLKVIRRRIKVLVAFCVLVPAFAVAISLTQKAEYQAESLVLISRQSLANQLNGSADVGLQQQSFQQVLSTQAQLARTPRVLQKTLEATPDLEHPVSTGELRASSTVTADPTSDLLRFTVTSGNTADAMRLARNYASSFVRYRLSLDSSALRKALTDIDSAITEARRGGSEQRNLVGRLASSRQQLETRLALQSANAQVVAVPESAPQVRPRPLRSGIIGLVLGLFVGALAVWLREALDTRVLSGDEAERALGAPVLARVREPQGAEDGLVMLREPTAVSAETFRILRNNLDFGIRANDAQTVLLTSATQGEGKSTTISNLAVAEALAGRDVILVDFDLRRPRLAQLFDLSGSGGVTAVALDQMTLDDALVTIDLPSGSVGTSLAASGRLRVLPAGALPPDPSEFIGSPAVERLIAQLRAAGDLVLLDSPPVLAVSDTASLFSYADAAFVCVRLGLVRKPMLRDLKSSLMRLDTPIIGIAITGAGTTDRSYDGYYGYVAQPVPQT